MKIRHEISSKIDQKPLNKRNEGQQDFEKVVKLESQRIKQQHVQRLMHDITILGEKIARFRSFQDLAKYKRMIKQFLQETVSNGLTLKESRNFTTTHQSHTLKTVQEIDEKLIELTEDMMDQEKKTVDLLGVIGEIRGLLINLSI